MAQSKEVPPGMAVDPVCGRQVLMETAVHTLKVGRLTYYFCSGTCKFEYSSNLDKEKRKRPVRFVG